MKKAILLALCATVVYGLQAQITLTQSNMVFSDSYNDIRHRNTSGITIPAHGANMTYNYTSLQGSTIDTIPYLPATRAGFTGFTRFNYSRVFLGNIPLYSEYYDHIDADGLSRVGLYKLPQKVGLGAVSGNNDDTLEFPGNNSIFSQPNYHIKFPATYQSTWTSDVIFTVDYLITVSAFGLNKAPGQRLQYVSQVDSVVGWGNITIPTATGHSIPYEVLLVKQSKFVIDSTFLGGSPAPPAMMSALGLTQGDAFTLNTYYFYAAGFERPLLFMEMSEDWQTPFYSIYSSNDVETLSNGKLMSAGFKVFPNPAQKSSTVSFETVENRDALNLTIYCSKGSLVHSASISAKSNDQLKWDVPADIRTGLYFYQISDVNGASRASGKLLVN